MYATLKELYPNNAFKQYEYLNYLYMKHPSTVGVEARQQLFNSPTVMFLLNRGKKATEEWSVESLFEEKQNDTADCLVVKDDFFELVDVKSRNLGKKAQPPNIISAYKMAETCKIMVDNNDFDSFSLNYVELGWEEMSKPSCIKIKDMTYKNIFKTVPTNLYINWAAAMQIQFHVAELQQDYNGTVEHWCRLYVTHFVNEAKRRLDIMKRELIIPFEPYCLKD